MFIAQQDLASASKPSNTALVSESTSSQDNIFLCSQLKGSDLFLLKKSCDFIDLKSRNHSVLPWLSVPRHSQSQGRRHGLSGCVTPVPRAGLGPGFFEVSPQGRVEVRRCPPCVLVFLLISG